MSPDDFWKYCSFLQSLDTEFQSEMFFSAQERCKLNTQPADTSDKEIVKKRKKKIST